MKMMASITLFIRSGVICPTLRKTICLSAVKIRKGRINESTGNEPDAKSSDLNACANISSVGWDVIWQIIMSSPLRSVKTNAGRLLLPDKSEKGKGTTTTSPFTNLSMLHLLQRLTNLLPKRFRLQGRVALYLPSLGGAFQSVHPICALTPIAIACCSSTCFVSSKSPYVRSIKFSQR